jgi:hypothetical protein
MAAAEVANSGATVPYWVSQMPRYYRRADRLGTLKRVINPISLAHHGLAERSLQQFVGKPLVFGFVNLA